ncbi:MAG: hypothetical protein ACOC9P_01070 [bacterium]
MVKEDKDLSHLIERVEAFEERVGVHLQAMSATHVGFFDYTTIQVYGEVTSRTGNTLAADVDVFAVVYDTEGKVVAARTCTIRAAEFLDFAVFGIQVNGLVQEPARVRVFPQAVATPHGHEAPPE